MPANLFALMGVAGGSLRPTVTGGTESTIAGWKIHTFQSATPTADATFTLTVSVAPVTIEYLIVGGGGAGGINPTSGRGGGGGGGGVRTGSTTLSVGSYSVVVGRGGHWTSSTAPVLAGDSSIQGVATAQHGGRGGYCTSATVVVNAEASLNSLTTFTGGGAWGQTVAGNGKGWGRRYSGGTNAASSSRGGGGGAGAGAGAAGDANSPEAGVLTASTHGQSYDGSTVAGGTAGAGGDGIASSITGSSVYYGGGGAGAGQTNGNGRLTGGPGPVPGGLGGGANAAWVSGGVATTFSGNSGTDHLGGGASGSGIGTAITARGGCGIVIIRYAI